MKNQFASRIQKLKPWLFAWIAGNAASVVAAAAFLSGGFQPIWLRYVISKFLMDIGLGGITTTFSLPLEDQVYVVHDLAPFLARKLDSDLSILQFTPVLVTIALAIAYLLTNSKKEG